MKKKVKNLLIWLMRNEANLWSLQFDNLDEFKTLHPALANVKREQMLEGNVAAFHPGALKYFREKGLLQ